MENAVKFQISVSESDIKGEKEEIQKRDIKSIMMT